jgi:predicted transcriptional regulator
MLLWSEAMKERIERLAKYERRSISMIMRLALEDYLSQHTTNDSALSMTSENGEVAA